MTQGDAELVRRCLAGEQGAWETLVRAHHGRIYNLAYRYVGRFDEAEDLAQEIFVKVYRGLSAYRIDSGTLVGWLLRVGRNHIIDRYRQSKVELSRTDSLDDRYERIGQNPSRHPDPAEALERRERADIIHRALLGMSQDLREAVILRDLEGLTYEEIARLLGVPLGTIKSRISRGRGELARIVRGLSKSK